MIRSADIADADGVQRGLGITLNHNAAAVTEGHMTPVAGADADLQARVKAAADVLRLETQRLDVAKLDAALQDVQAGRQVELSDQELKDLERLSDLRKKYADEVYHAEEQYENQLQALREKDFRSMNRWRVACSTPSTATLLTSGARTSCWGRPSRCLRTPRPRCYSGVGHALGGLTGGNDLGGLLHGTILDPANKGAGDASTTAKQTTRTADQVFALRGDIRALMGTTAPAGGSADLGGGSDISSLTCQPRYIANCNPLLNVLGLTGQVPGGGFVGTGASSLFQSGSGNDFTQFMSGLGGGGSNPLGAIFGGWSTHGDTMTQLTGAQQAGVAAGTAAMLAGAGMTIASGISQGGVGGYAKATSAGLGVAASLDPDPLSKTLLGVAAMATSVIGSLFGQNPQQRQKDIANEIGEHEYLAPTAMNVTQGMNGTYEDFDARGNLRTSTLSAVPTVAEPYIDSYKYNGQKTFFDAPGQVTSPYSGTPAGGSGQAPISNNTTIIVQALDSESLHEYLQKPSNSHAVGESLASHLERHDGRAANAIRYVSSS